MQPKLNHPVDLLRDEKGIYGIGVAKEAEIELPPSDLILRCDRLPEGGFIGNSILQRISGGFRHGMFTHTAEEHLRKVIHFGMLNKAGLHWPPVHEPFQPNVRYWS